MSDLYGEPEPKLYRQTCVRCQSQVIRTEDGYCESCNQTEPEDRTAAILRQWAKVYRDVSEKNGGAVHLIAQAELWEREADQLERRVA